MATDTYHHGNLRQALLDHAVELACTGGPDAVVLRDVQRMAGVSNSAAYRHYSDRGALLGAVTEYAESRLADAMVARLNAVPEKGPKAKRAVDRLRATGQGTSTSHSPSRACSGPHSPTPKRAATPMTAARSRKAKSANIIRSRS